MRIYGLNSGKNNIPIFLARSYIFNKNKKNKIKIKNKKKNFLQKKSFEDYNVIDWICFIIFIIGIILIVCRL